MSGGKRDKVRKSINWGSTKQQCGNYGTNRRVCALVAGLNRGPLEKNYKFKIMLEKTDVEGVLKGTMSLIGCNIKVGVSKSKLTLTGMVHSLDQKGEAERIAWKALGVWTVSNELVIE